MKVGKIENVQYGDIVRAPDHFVKKTRSRIYRVFIEVWRGKVGLLGLGKFEMWVEGDWNSGGATMPILEYVSTDEFISEWNLTPYSTRPAIYSHGRG